MSTGRAMRLALAPCLVLLLLFLWIVYRADSAARPGRLLAVDYGVYFSAAKIVDRGGNPYDHQTLVATNRTALSGPETDTPPSPLVRVGEPPILFWLFKPLTKFHFIDTVWPALGLLAVLSALGVTSTARALGWNRPLIPLAIGLAMPATVLYVHFGNVGVVVFACFGMGLWLASRYPFLAGAVLSVALWKPQIALPLAGLIVLFHTGSRRRSIAGFLTGMLGSVLGSGLAVGLPSVGLWLRSFTDFATTLPHQGDIPTAAGLYVAWAPHVVSVVLASLSIALASAGTVAVYWRLRRSPNPVPVRSLAWLWLVWFLAAPYGHLADEVFLAPVLLCFFASAGRADKARAVLLLYGGVLSVLLQNVHPGRTSLLGNVPRSV